MTRKFGAESTAEEVARDIDLTGRTIVVTGVSAGLGVETARVLAARGARVVCVARDKAKTEAAVAGLRSGNPKGAFEIALLDLADLDSVRRGADDIARRFPKIHILINNAGVMACPLGRTKQGLDLQLGTNHLGHYVLTARLLPSLLAAAPGRIVNLSSGGHRMSDVRFDDPLFEKQPYDKWAAYGQAKTANILFSVALDERYASRGLRAFAVHPGAIHTELGRHLSQDDFKAMMGRRPQSEPMKFKQVPQGAATSVWAATAPELEGKGGVYCEDCGIAEPIKDLAGASGVMPYALDRASAQKLLVLSEQWSGEKLPA
ncbi:MAG: SDR family NAD(P)-dependent oxidoreductase [Deltaproteobacteria bacterium]|nr:SDR family NAD(P)-dependent oxidoreductase [Deltaproteobacteria bacterium]